MKLIGNSVGIEIVKKTNFNPNGKVIVPPGTWRKTDEAVVRYLGNDVTISINIGDRVIYDRFAQGNVWKIANRDVFIVSQDDIVAKIEV